MANLCNYSITSYNNTFNYFSIYSVGVDNHYYLVVLENINLSIIKYVMYTVFYVNKFVI